MRNLAIIPARSGSKGLKNKNIKLLNGKPLLSYSIASALESEIFDDIMVSTDSSEYAQIAVSYGASVPFLRSELNSNDIANSWDAVLEVLRYYFERNIRFDTVCLLQPTSPLRKSKDIIIGYQALLNNDCNCIYGVCECDHSPLWTNTLPLDRNMKSFFNKEIQDKNRQQLDQFYRINGALYIKKIVYEDTIRLIDNNPFAIVMNRYSSIDIDSQLDFEIAEFLITKNHEI